MLARQAHRQAAGNVAVVFVDADVVVAAVALGDVGEWSQALSALCHRYRSRSAELEECR